MEATFQLLQGIGIALLIMLNLYVLGKLFGQRLWSRFAPVKTVNARCVDKFKNDHFTNIYSSAAKPATYTVVFEIAGKKRSFPVSEFSWKSYKVGASGTLKYQGNHLIDFH